MVFIQLHKQQAAVGLNTEAERDHFIRLPLYKT